MVTRKSWNEFRESGMLWWINTILHTFGWAIVIDMEDDRVVDAYPARVKFRGFDEERSTKGYKQVSQYMVDNAQELLKEANE
jgi:hypothetical protein